MAEPGAPQVVVEACHGALRLFAVDASATAEGLGVGMTLADARARIPVLAVAEAEPAADLALLVRLGEACRRFTPALALHAPDGLDLDVTGCAALFGGEARLLLAVGVRMRRYGLSVRSALADTAALAYAAARFGQGGVVAQGVRAAVLAPLPIEALRLDTQGCKVLRQLGLRRVGQLLELPRPALARRLGPDALRRLDEALGARAGPLELSLEQPPFRAERRVFEPVCDVEPVLQVVGDLARDLAVQLQGRGQGARVFTLELYRVDGALRRLAVAASRPLRHAPLIAALFAERLAGLEGDGGLQADFGFDQFRLIAGRTETVASAPGELLDAAADAGAAGALVDRIAARGGAVVRRLSPVDVHGPEHADVQAPFGAPAVWTGDRAAARFLDTPLRPLRLFRPAQPINVVAAEIPEGPPARFTWRRVTHTVVRAEGPERLEPEWALHREPACVRDYYRLEDEGGRRYWVFRQDRYDAPEPSPSLASLAAQREEVSREKGRREAIKPVRPPPKPERPVPLRLISPSSPPPAETGTGPAGNDAGEARSPPAHPPRPAWFLHGLFG